MSSQVETCALIDSSSETKVYKKRWSILLIFSLIAIMQDTIWNTWNPIDSTASIVYGWSDDMIELLASYGYIFYIIAFLPVVYILKTSVRKAMCFSTFLMTLGTVWRALYLQDPHVNAKTFTVSCHICSILNGISNIAVGSAPLVISAVWFPPEERVTATAISQVFTGMSSGVSFLLANQIVRPIDNLLPNGTMPSPDKITPEILEDLIQDLRFYMFSNAIPAGLLFVFIIVFFPSSPALPPSNSSIQTRLDFLSSFKHVLMNKDAWLIVLGLSMSQGVLFAWSRKIVMNLKKICVGTFCLKKNWILYLCVYTTLATTGVTIIFARIADMTRIRVKKTIILLLSFASVVFLFISLISLGILQFASIFSVKAVISFLLIIGNCLVVSTMPLGMEMLMEICYPASEAVVGGCVSLCVNIFTISIISLFHISHIGTAWLNYSLPASCLLGGLALLPVRVEYNRMVVDRDTVECVEED